MRDEDTFSRDVAQRQRDVFRLYVGQGKRISYAALADVTGVSKSTWESYAGGVAMPSHNLFRLIRALPREAGNMLMEPSGQRLVPVDAPSTDWLMIGEKIANLQGKICKYERTGGFIDHAEDADLRNEFRSILADAPGDA